MSSAIASFLRTWRTQQEEPKTKKKISLSDISNLSVDVLKLIDAGVYVTILRTGDVRLIKTYMLNEKRDPLELHWVMDKDWQADIDVLTLNAHEKSILIQMLELLHIDFRSF